MPPRAEVPPPAGLDNEDLDPNENHRIELPMEAMIHILFDTLRTTQDDPDIVGSGLVALLSDVSENRTTVLETGALRTLVGLLRRHKNNANIVELVLRNLRILEGHGELEDHWLTLFVEIGGISAQASAMGAHLDNHNVQYIGSIMLVSLLKYENLLVGSFCEAGGVSALCQALTRLERDTPIQRMGCIAISTLLRRSDADSLRRCQDTVVASGGVLLLLNTIKGCRVPSSEAELHALHLTIRTMECIVHKNNHAKTTFVALEGIPSILQVLERHAGRNGSSIVLASSLAFIRDLSLDREDIPEALRQEHIVNVVHRSMEQHADDGDVADEAIMLLGYLTSCCSGLAESLVTTGVFDSIVETMGSHCDNDDLQRSACTAIVLCFDELDDALLENTIRSTPHVFGTILAVMNEHPTEQDLQFSACLALKYCPACPEMCYNFVHSQGLDAIVSAMRQFPDNMNIQDVSCLAFHGMILALAMYDSTETTEFGTTEVVMETGYVPTLFDAMRRHSDDPTFLQNALHSLMTIVVKDYRLEDVVDASDGVQVLETLQQSEDGRVSRDASVLLKVLTGSAEGTE